VVAVLFDQFAKAGGFYDVDAVSEDGHD